MTANRNLPKEYILKIQNSTNKYGVIGTLNRVEKKIVRKIAAKVDPSTRNRIQILAARAAEFDSKFGVSTAGIVYQTQLKSDNPNQRYAYRYEGSDPLNFRLAIEALPITYRQFLFVDFGSGKGRAILLASEFPFKKSIGVEFSEELHVIAEANIEHYHNPEAKCHAVESRCLDALQYVFPKCPTVCYFGNPFEEPIMSKMRGNIEASLRKMPRKLFVVYYNPTAGQLFDESPYFEPLTVVGPVKIWQAKVCH